MAKSHPNKEIREAIAYAVSKGWTIEPVGNSAHAWGQMKCPYNDSNCRDGKYCRVGIWSTPRNTMNHAKQIRNIVDKCQKN